MNQLMTLPFHLTAKSTSSPQSVPSTREPKQTRTLTLEMTTQPTTSKWIFRRRTNTRARRLCMTGRVKTPWNRGRRGNSREWTSSPYESGQQVENVATPPSQVPFKPQKKSQGHSWLSVLLTGHPSWGIAWYLNDLLIPELTVERGQTYTFLVEGGNDETQPARYVVVFH